MKIAICIISLFIVLFDLKAQSTEKGLILPKDKEYRSSEKYGCVLSPDEGFLLYDSPGGKNIGTIKRIITDDQSFYKIFYVDTSGLQKELPPEYMAEVSYEIWALRYEEKKENYIRIGSGKDSAWINLEELEEQQFQTVSWMHYFIDTSNNVLGYYANEPGLRIRTQPSSSGEIAGSVRGDLFEIKLLNETNGNWFKVKVKKYKEHPCKTDLDETVNMEYIQEGWIKVIDDEGNPNLWSYVRGC